MSRHYETPDLDYRDLFLKLVEDGALSAEHALLMCVKWMSQDDVRQMMHANEITGDCYDL